RLERRAGLAATPYGAIESAPHVVGAADHRQDVAVVRVDRHECRLEVGPVQPPQASGNRALRGVLQGTIEGGPHTPVGRMVTAELVAELLAQVVLRPTALAFARLLVRLDPRPRAERRLILIG